MPNDTQEKKVRKSPVPANADRIKEGALNLQLKDRVALRNILTDSINVELAKMEREFNESKELVNPK